MKIVTLNLRYPAPGDGKNYFFNRLPLIVERIHQEAPDVLCFQEAMPESLQAGFGTQEAIGVAELIDGDTTIATALLYPAQGVGERTFLTGLGQALRDWLVLGE